MLHGACFLQEKPVATTTGQKMAPGSDASSCHGSIHFIAFAGTLPQLLNFQSPLQKTAYLTARAKFTIVNCREERNCTKAACPVDCKWNDWSDWCRPQFLYSVLRDVLLSLYLFYFPSHHEMVCFCVLSFAFDLHCFHLSQAG